MVYNIREVRWTKAILKGTEGYFCNERIKYDDKLERVNIWELADNCDEKPCRYKPHIMVNFYGTFITLDNKLPIEWTEMQEGFIKSEKEWRIIGEKSITYKEVEEEWFGK